MSSSPRPLVVANLKAQLAPRRERELARAIAHRLLAAPELIAQVELLLAPSALSLATIHGDLAEMGIALSLAAQDCSEHESGAHTGELTATALADLAATVLIGHAERRAAGEQGALLGRKLARAVAAGLRPILCFADPADGPLVARGGAIADEWNAIRDAAESLGVDEPTIARSGLVLAYEPQSAIGSGAPLAPSAASAAASALREIAGDYPVLYGGSVAGAGAAAYLAPMNGEGRLDGLLVGGASLDPARLLAIVAALA